MYNQCILNSNNYHNLWPPRNHTSNFFYYLLSYGTTNQAFDPTPEQDIHHGQLRTIHDSDGKSRSSFDSLDTEEEEGSMTPRAIDQEEYVNREGKSAFYAPTTSTVSKIFLHLRSPFWGAINKHIRGFL